MNGIAIPGPVIAAVSHYYSDLFTHAELDNLLDRADAASADPGSSKKIKIRNRLEATNKRNLPPPLVVLGRLLEELIDGFVANRPAELVTAARAEIIKLLSARGLGYESPGTIGTADRKKNHGSTQGGAGTMPNQDAVKEKDPRSVFIIHGRNHNVVTELKKILFSVGLRTEEFDTVSADLGNKSSIFEIVQEGVARVQSVIVLFTPDELAVLQVQFRGSDKGDDVARFQPRPNVLYEAGLAFSLNPTGTILVSVGKVAFPSDLAGIHYVKLSNTPPSRKLLIDKLAATGAAVDPSGLSYLDSKHGDFSDSIASVVEFHDPFSANSAQSNDIYSKLKRTVEAVTNEIGAPGLVTAEKYLRLKSRLVTAVQMLGEPHAKLSEELNKDSFVSLGGESETQKSDYRRKRILSKLERIAGLLEALE